jgi:hypothetical protein
MLETEKRLRRFMPSCFLPPGATTMTPLRKRMTEDMQLRNYAAKTVENYTRHIGCFAKHFGKSPEYLGPEEVRATIYILNIF